jgi:type VI protein secretion system component VasK
VYNALKAYLIPTNNHDKRWTEFVTVLVQHWKKDQPVGPDREAQATANFVFYADELPDVNPYPQYSVPDKDAVTNARTFLNGFPLEDSIYRSMLDAAGDKLKSIVFNRDYPDTQDTVRNVFRVEPWFTKLAYINFQKRLQNPDANFDREEWVLGPLTQRNIDWAKIATDLKTRYDQDFINTWRDFLSATSEAVPYGSFPRASAVLERLGSPTSPLMQLFCVASENTNVPSKEVMQAFQPVQLVTPPGCPTKLISSDAKPYVAGLGNLSNALKSIGSQGNPNEAAALSAKNAVSEALNAENALQLNFQPDPSDPKSTVLDKSQTLLKDPIQRVDPTLEGIAGAAINGQASSVCAAINPVFRKYPFNPSGEDATLQEVNEVLNPATGKLWDFVRGTLGPYVQKSGNSYIATMGQTAKITPSFLNFLNRAALMSQALYHGDASANPNMNFTIHAMPSPDVDHVTLSIDGATLSGDPKTGVSQSFPWPGSAQDFTLLARFGGSSSDFTMVHKPGLWAVWHALERAERNGNNVQWTQATEGVGPTMINGHPLTVNFGLDATSGQILRAQYFSGLGCPTRAVQ